MARVVVIGAGLGGLPAAYELRHVLPREHKITLISNQPKFTFVPSLPWVALGLKSLDSIQLDPTFRS
jgi:sulfide:quinone oxidoreductase